MHPLRLPYFFLDRRTALATSYRLPLLLLYGVALSLICVLGIVLDQPKASILALTMLATQSIVMAYSWWLVKWDLTTGLPFALLTPLVLVSRIVLATMVIWLVTRDQFELSVAGWTALSCWLVLGLSGTAPSVILQFVEALTLVATTLVLLVIHLDQAHSPISAILAGLLWLGATMFFLGAVIYLRNRQVAADQKAEDLAHAQKMEAVGRLTGGIAHDFNNLLTVIGGNLDLIDETKDPQLRASMHKEARLAVDRGAELIRKLLSASRKSVMEKREVEPVAFLTDFVTLCDRVLPASIKLHLYFHIKPPDVFSIDISQLESALLNLVVNARDAMEVTGGAISLSVARVSLSEPEQGPGWSLKAGNYMRLRMEDEGEGIPAELLDKVTDPYMTTKTEGKGTGMGLAMVRGFAEQSGGALRLKSTKDVGTTVDLYLPAEWSDT